MYVVSLNKCSNWQNSRRKPLFTSYLYAELTNSGRNIKEVSISLRYNCTNGYLYRQKTHVWQQTDMSVIKQLQEFDLKAWQYHQYLNNLNQNIHSACTVFNVYVYISSYLTFLGSLAAWLPLSVNFEGRLQKVTNTRDVFWEVGRKLLSTPGDKDKLWPIL